jgi:hypothetical protein
MGRFANLFNQNLILSTICLFCAPAFAGTTVTQVVTTKLEKDESKATYLWMLDSDKFKLRVTSDNGEVQYVFNGRNFYVCGKVAEDLLNQLKGLNVTDQQFLKDLGAGSCQAVPANFMARFFLSPAGAISSIDYSDGMELTLEMQKYEFKAEGPGEAAKIPCTNATRNLEVTRKLDAANGRYQKIDELICYTNKFDWRPTFWKQISRNLIRQPSARGLYKSLQEDQEKLQGFVLKSTGSFEKADSKGVTRSGQRTIDTSSVVEGAIAASEFSPPTGYAMVDIQAKILASKDRSAEGTKGYEVEKDPVPVLLYWVLGGVL